MSAQVFELHGQWSPEALKTPPGEYMKAYLDEIVDARNYELPFEDWHTDDFSSVKPNGEEVTGGKAAFGEILAALYGPFSANYHEVQHTTVWEASGDWQMIGIATMYADLLVPGEGQKVKSANGKEWDIRVPLVARFWLKKDKRAKVAGLLMKRSELFADSFPIVEEMMKRGMIQQ